MAAAFKIFRNIPNSRLPLTHIERFKSTQKNSIKVTLCGAAGAVGQTLSLLLKQSPYIDELALFDLKSTEGLALELGYVDTKCKVASYNESIANEAFLNASIVVVACGSRVTMSDEENSTFRKNGNKIKELAKLIATYSPHAMVAVASNPIDGMVPLMAECLKQKITFNPSKLLGVTMLNVIRANTYVAEVQGLEPECVSVHVVGGNTIANIVPVLSHAKPCNDLTDEEISRITKGVQCADRELQKLKVGGTPTLSASFAIARMVVSMIKGLKGMSNIIECAFVRTDVYPNTKYLATPILLGPNGVTKHLGVDNLSAYEKMQLDAAIHSLQVYQKRAKDFLGVKPKPLCDPCDPKSTIKPCPANVCAKKKRKEGLIPVESIIPLDEL